MSAVDSGARDRRRTVSIIIPSWNGRALLADALPAIAALDYPRDDVEVIVFDNGSVDGSAAWLRDSWPAVRILESATNLGFAEACNRAAASARGDLLAFVNNDVRLDPAWLIHMTEAVSATGAAAAGGRILDWTGARYDFDGPGMNFYGHGVSRRHGRRVRPEAAPPPPTPALFACGAAMIAERARFLASGGFDADYFAYFEDVDLGWRLWVLGEEVLYVPAAVAYHRHHGSGLGAERRTQLLETNALASVVKNYDDANLGCVLPAALLLLEARARLAGGAHAAPYRDTVARFLEALPDLRRKRTGVQARRRRPDAEIVALFREPMRPSFFGRAYWREQARMVRAFDITGVVGDGMMDDFIEQLQGRIEELEAEHEALRRDAETGAAERERLAAEVARLRDELRRRGGEG